MTEAALDAAREKLVDPVAFLVMCDRFVVAHQHTHLLWPAAQRGEELPPMPPPLVQYEMGSAPSPLSGTTGWTLLAST